MGISNPIVYRHETANMDNKEALYEAAIRDAAGAKLPQKIAQLNEKIEACEQRVLRTEERILSIRASDTPLYKIGRIALTAGAWAAIPVVCVACLVNLLLLHIPAGIALGVSFVPLYAYEAISSRKPVEAAEKTIDKIMRTFGAFNACFEACDHYLISTRPLEEKNAKEKLVSEEYENPYDARVHIYILSDNAKPNVIKRFSLEQVKSIYDKMTPGNNQEATPALPTKAELNQRIKNLQQNIARIRSM